MLSQTCSAYELPDLGRPSTQVLSTKEEQKLGKEFMREVRRSATIINDTIIVDYLQNLGQHLVKNSLAPDKKFHFFVVQDQTINAFAGPDSNIGVNSGLILTTKNESELAAVLAHEISHVTQHHIERSLEQIHELNIPMTAAMIAAILLGAKSGNGAATGAAMSLAAGGTQHMINFTRANEAEADRIGMATLYKAGFDPHAMPNFFNRMQTTNLEYGTQIPPFLLTHPVTSDRIADAENRAIQYKKPNVTSSPHYYLIRARLQYLTLSNTPTAANFKDQFATGSKDMPEDAINYGYTLALIENHKLTEANTTITALINKNPNEVLYQMAKAQIQIMMNQPKAAAITLKNAYTTHHGYYPLALQYAQTLTASKQPQEAQNILKQQPISASAYSTNNNDTATYFSLAESAAKGGNLADAYRYRAKALISIGAYQRARILLQQALQLPDLSSNMKDILQSDLDNAKILIKQEKEGSHRL